MHGSSRSPRREPKPDSRGADRPPFPSPSPAPSVRLMTASAFSAWVSSTRTNPQPPCSVALGAFPPLLTESTGPSSLRGQLSSIRVRKVVAVCQRRVFAGSQLQQIEAEVHFSHLLIVLTQGSLLTSQNLFLLTTLWMEMGSYLRSEMRTQE